MKTYLFTTLLGLLCMGQAPVAQTPAITFDSTCLPHRVNDYWQYKMVIPNGRSYIFTIEVIGKEVFQGQNCWVFETKSPATHTTSRRYYIFRNNMREDYGSDIPAENSYIKNTPAVVLPISNVFPQAGGFERTFHQSNDPDHTYTNCLYSYRFNNTDRFWFRPGGTQYTATKLDYHETVTDAGKDYNIMESSATEWYVKGIGLVKSEGRNANGTIGSYYTLIKAKINGLVYQ
jgi:hypothetical protein